MSISFIFFFIIFDNYFFTATLVYSILLNVFIYNFLYFFLKTKLIKNKKMVKYFLLYFYLILIVSSILGYGFLLANFLNKNLLKYNLGYIGILGLLALVLISYTTIFFIKHDYVHNSIIHFIGLISFAYFFRKLKLNKDYILLIILIFFLSSSLFILKNHDDFSYYHLTYSLGLTENKIQLGLGNLGIMVIDIIHLYFI